MVDAWVWVVIWLAFVGLATVLFFLWSAFSHFFLKRRYKKEDDRGRRIQTLEGIKRGVEGTVRGPELDTPIRERGVLQEIEDSIIAEHSSQPRNTSSERPIGLSFIK